VKIQYSNVLQESVLDGLNTWASNQLYYIVLCGNFTTKLPRRANSLYVSQMFLCFWWNGMLNCAHSLTHFSHCVCQVTRLLKDSLFWKNVTNSCVQVCLLSS